MHANTWLEILIGRLNLHNNVTKSIFYLQISRDISPGQGVGIELFATFQLVLCVIATTDKRRRDVTGSAPLAIGLSVCLGHLTAVSNQHSLFSCCCLFSASAFL